MMPPPTQSFALSPSAFTRFLGCEHRTYLDILERRGELDAERKPPSMELLFERGDRHEDAIVERFIDEGHDVVKLDDQDASRETRAGRTLEAMRDGREILHQGCFLRDGWVGYPDFLIKVDTPSALGDWSYEVYDAKLSAHAAPRHIFQLLFYNEELTRLQGRAPDAMHLMLGDNTQPAFRPDEFEAYANNIRAQFVARLAELEAPDANPVYPYKVPACDFCHWWHVCDQRRRDDDHVSLTATVHRAQGLKLEAAGVHTLPALATLPEDRTIPRLSALTLDNVRAQADLQLRSRGLERPLYEVLAPGFDRGLGRLPEPSAGDVHFDFEGDPNWGDDGLEYLFGTVYEDAGRPVYYPLWAISRARGARRAGNVDRLDHRSARAVPGPSRLSLQLV